MPIYEYKCSACDHELERLQKMSDEPLKDCPECGKPNLVKMISAAGFRLKGSGWYETDFKSGDKKNVADSKKPDSKKPDSKKSAAVPGKAGNCSSGSK